jgi:hypothetical protein
MQQLEARYAVFTSLGDFLRTGWDVAYDALHHESEVVRTGLRRELAWHSAEIRAAVQWL